MKRLMLALSVLLLPGTVVAETADVEKSAAPVADSTGEVPPPPPGEYRSTTLPQRQALPPYASHRHVARNSGRFDRHWGPRGPMAMGGPDGVDPALRMEQGPRGEPGARDADWRGNERWGERGPYRPGPWRRGGPMTNGEPWTGPTQEWGYGGGPYGGNGYDMGYSPGPWGGPGPGPGTWGGRPWGGGPWGGSSPWGGPGPWGYGGPGYGPDWGYGPRNPGY